MVISARNSWNIIKGRGRGREKKGEEAATSLIQVPFCSSKTQHWHVQGQMCTALEEWRGEEGEGMLATTAEVLRLAVKVISTGKSNGLLKSNLEGEVLFPNKANGSLVLDVKGLNTVWIVK